MATRLDQPESRALLRIVKPSRLTPMTLDTASQILSGVSNLALLIGKSGFIVFVCWC